MKKILLSILLALSALTPVYAQTNLSQGGTGWSASTAGDLLVGTSSVLRYSRFPAGTAGYVLQASSTSPFKMAWVATSTLGFSGGGGGTPASPDTSVQFNDGGSFGGDAGFLWDKTTDTMSLGVEAGLATITTPSAVSTDTSGGSLSFMTGSGDGIGIGGGLNFQAGAGGANGSGGGFTMASGNGNGSGNGGNIDIYSGDGGVSGVPGTTSISAGNAGTGSDGNGGNVVLFGGAKDGTGQYGYVSIQRGPGFHNAFLDAQPLTGDQIFGFPDETGTFALGTGTAGNCAQWSTTNTLTDTGSPCGSGGGGISNAYASSTFPSFDYASTTYYLASNPNNFISLASLSGTAPITYNNGTGAIGCTTASSGVTGCISGTDWDTFNNKVSNAYASSTFPSFTYGTSTYAPISTTVTNTYASSTFPSFTYATNTFATIANYPTYTYATNTFMTYTYGTSTFPSFTYATATYPSFTYATATYVSIINNQTIAGAKTFTGTSTFATTTTNGSSTFVGQAYFANASSSALSVSGNFFVTGTSTFATSTHNGSSTFVGQVYMGNASSSGLTGTNFYSTLANITKAIFTNATTTNFTLSGLFYDSVNATGTVGQVLTSTGTSTLWSTSSGGISNAYASSTFPSFTYATNTYAMQSSFSGTIGKLARWTSTSALGSGIVFDNGTVAGVNATTSTSTFNIQGVSGSTNTIFNVASSSANPILSVSPAGNGRVGIGTTTPFVQLHIFSTNTSGVDPAIILGGNVAGDTDFWIGRPNNNDSADNDYFAIGEWGGSTIATSTSYFTIDTNGNASVGSTTPAARFSILGASGATVPTFQVATSTGTSLFNVLSNGNVGISSSTPGSLFSVGTSLAVSPTAPGTNILDVASSTGTIFFGVSQNGHIITNGNAASVSLCGTSPSISGTDRKGKITTGTGAPTNCTVTFNQAYVSAPICVANPSAGSVVIASSTTTGFSMTFSAGLTSGSVYYICEE